MYKILAFATVIKLNFQGRPRARNETGWALLEHNFELYWLALSSYKCCSVCDFM